MKKINFIERVQAIETFQIEYTEEDFENDRAIFEIENFTFEDLCMVFEGYDEIMIEVNDSDWNAETRDWEPCRKQVNAYDFFINLMSDMASEEGPWESELVDLLSRETLVEDDESYPS